MPRHSLLPGPTPKASRFGHIVAVVGAAVFVTGVLAASPARPLVPPQGVAHMVRSTAELAPVDVASTCSAEMVLVGSVCVDRWEATLVSIDDDGREEAHSPYEAPNGKRVKAISRAGVTPQAHISKDEAKRACRAAGKRLCRGAEWRKACQGPQGTRYPYGGARKPGACVDSGRTSPVHKLHGGDHSVATMNDPRLNQVPGTVAKTGAAAECVNDYGVHDMVGNLHEWTDDGAFRGGYYLDTTQNGEGCDYKTTAHATSYYDYSTGFRCCADP
ncbi:MAG: SUMF1/EgtB/PvdO family nonheme iron enzyme [Myxococcales bacterium]|nr:SUMF1/EgtB/PvdO family nonheme iron enzyme [Myxococcales bacterium]